jgi:sporulation protein YlmC with PRC-barrel domain
MRHMRFNRYSALALAGVLLALAPAAASAQEVALVAPDAKEVAKGYRANELKLRSVVNDKGEIIGHIDDFIFGRDNGPIFAVLKVGDFVGLEGELVAVPFRNLKLDDSSGQIVLPGASRTALQKLPVFLYNR